MRGVVLVADDDDDVRSLIELALRSDGIDAVPATDGAAAVEWVRRNGPPAALVLDVQMPRLDGWATLDQLRSISGDFPVLVCTVKVRDADRARRERVAFLTKPFSVEQLTDAVRGLLGEDSEGADVDQGARG